MRAPEIKSEPFASVKAVLGNTRSKLATIRSINKISTQHKHVYEDTGRLSEEIRFSYLKYFEEPNVAPRS